MTLDKMLKNIINKKANSLIEVLIVLGVISTTMVAAVNVIVQNLNQIKINEIDDIATGIMIEGMEISKSPTDVVTSTDNINIAAVGTSLFYSLDNSSSIKVLKLETNTAGAIKSCGENSNYKIETELENVPNTLRICLQIEIIPLRGPSDVRYYEIVSRVVYKLPKTEAVNTIRGYRYDNFQTAQDAL